MRGRCRFSLQPHCRCTPLHSTVGGSAGLILVNLTHETSARYDEILRDRRYRPQPAGHADDPGAEPSRPCNHVASMGAIVWRRPGCSGSEPRTITSSDSASHKPALHPRTPAKRVPVAKYSLPKYIEQGTCNTYGRQANFAKKQLGSFRTPLKITLLFTTKDMENHQMFKRIRAARKAKSLSQSSLAEAIGVNRATIAHWERPNGFSPGTKHLLILSQVLEVDVAWLTDDSVTTISKVHSAPQDYTPPNQSQTYLEEKFMQISKHVPISFLATVIAILENAKSYMDT